MKKPPPSSLPPNYVLQAVVRGAPRAVCRAAHRPTGTIVHLKEARNRRAAIREARILRRVASPFTPHLFSFLRLETRYWIAAHWVDGDPRTTHRDPPPSWPSDFLRALCHLHRRGVVHADLKPDNMLQRPNGSICLVDFDYALRVGEEEEFTETGGTIGYLAPERVSGWPADPRSDLYSAAKVIEAIGAEDRLRDLLAPLLAHAPANRPSQTDELLAQVVAVCGLGHVPPPDLALAGWHAGRTDEETLTIGLTGYLGCNAIISTRLARLLLESSGGRRDQAQAIWSEWLPRLGDDPWQPISPDSIENALPGIETIARRLTRAWFLGQPDEVRMASGIAAQIGERFTVSELEGVGLVAVPQETVGTLIDRGVVRRDPTGSSAETSAYRFTTRALWELACDALDSQRAAELHCLFADRLTAEGQSADLDPSALSRLAWHEEKAGQLVAAAAHYFEAGEKADRQGFSAELLAHFEHGWRALSHAHGAPVAMPPVDEVLTTMPTEECRRRIDIHANALGLVGRVEEGERWLETMRRLFTDDLTRARYHAAMARLLLRRDRYEEVLSHVEAGLAIPIEDDDLKRRLVLHKAQALVQLNRTEEAAQEAEKVSNLLRKGCNRRDLGTAVQLLGKVALQRGDLDRALKEWGRAKEIAKSARSPFLVSSSLLNLGSVTLIRGNHESAESMLEEAREIAEANNLEQLIWSALANLGASCARRERWAQSIIYWSEALRLALRDSRSAQALRAYAAIAKLMLRSGRISAAMRTLQVASRLVELGGNEILPLLLREMEIRVWYRDLPIDEKMESAAVKMSGDREEPWEREQLSILRSQSALHRGCGLDEVLVHLGEEARYDDLRGWHHLARARAYGHRGQVDKAFGGIDEALQAFTALQSHRYEKAFALLEQARLEAAGGRPGLRETLHDCSELSREIGARWIEGQALRLRSQALTTERGNR